MAGGGERGRSRHYLNLERLYRSIDWSKFNEVCKLISSYGQNNEVLSFHGSFHLTKQKTFELGQVQWMLKLIICCILS